MTKIKGIILVILISIPSIFLGKYYPVVGAPVFGIIFGMLISIVIKEKKVYEDGLKFISKKILQIAVILLGFGLNLNVIIQTGKDSLPIILSTIFTSLLIGYIAYKFLNIDKNTATLISVGSSICGGSAIAATAPIIKANDEEIAQSISVIFIFNVLAALIFPSIGIVLGMNANEFALFAGSAINDTSSVTASASTWDNIFNLGTFTLDLAITVKLTRTLAIIPISLFLSKKQDKVKGKFPFFIIFFIIASLITSIMIKMGINPKIFYSLKIISKYFILLAMIAIGLNTDILKLIKTGMKPIILGFICWISITIVSLILIAL